MGVVERGNGLSLEEFRSNHLSALRPELAITALGPETDSYQVTLESSTSLCEADFSDCFDLIQETSGDMYRQSSVGWSASKKRKEMRLPEMRYLLVKSNEQQGNVTDTRHQTSEGTTTKHTGSRAAAAPCVGGFLSFMITYEDGHEVIYCYELHLSNSLRRYGLGRKLMWIFEKIGHSVGVEKSMLTVFLDNEVGVKFYERIGYAEDDYSPAPKFLRNGKVKMPSYVILSKSIQ
ncbi:MAG: hypothetical protein M4579_000178 [Chaenotheca gracillima]|nr:MAG: hypothetical protein M4579_000178 [Chaenotheca gracillima]